MLEAAVLKINTNDSVNTPLAPDSTMMEHADRSDCDLDLFKETLSPIRSRPPCKAQVTPATVSTVLSASMSISSPHHESRASSSSSSSEQSQTHLRMVMPSPCRPRLDPRYAARLAAGTRSLLLNRQVEAELQLPPGISRDADSSIFRPTSIITCDNNNNYHHDGDCSPMDLSLEQPSPLTTDSEFKFFAPSPAFARSDSLETSFTLNSVATPRNHKKAQSTMDYGVSDRFIPSRATSSFNVNLWTNSNHSFANATNGNPTDGNTSPDDADESDETAAANPTTTAAPSQQTLLNSLLRTELLRENDVPSMPPSMPRSPPRSHTTATTMPLSDAGSNFRYTSPRQVYQQNVFDEAIGPTAVVNSFSLMPAASAASQRLLAVPSKRKRRISKVPFKVLDAPALQDDFYLNLVDWSSQNVLAVGLGSCVYLWSACTSKVTKLCDLAGAEDLVTSVNWAQHGTHLAVGTNRGEVQLWDTIKCRKVRTMAGHNARVGALAWTGPTLASGSRDRLVYLRDVRTQAQFTHQLNHHKQEVCGLKWSYDSPSFLASGGNDNKLVVLDSRNPAAPIHEFAEHTAAVKAIAWSPHQHGLLASGGGTADRCIRFFNTLSGASLNKIDTGSQVCNLAWSHNVNEIVSTHGYSLNQIVVWRYPSMTKVATLTGHTYRVLYLSVSPDGSTIVTGAGDETLRFWQVFPGPRSDGKESTGGLLFPQMVGSVIR